MYCCVGRSWNQSTQAEDKNANGINDIVDVMWDIIALCEDKHICKG